MDATTNNDETLERSGDKDSRYAQMYKNYWEAMAPFYKLRSYVQQLRLSFQ